MGYKATAQRPKTTQLVDDDQLNNILGTKMESGQLIRSDDYKDYSELEKDTEVGDLIKPQPFESINGRPEGTYGNVDIYKDNRIIALTPEDSGEDSYTFVFVHGDATNLNFTSLSGYTNAQIELVGGGGAGHSDGMGGGGGYYTYLEGKNIATAKNYPITVGIGGEKDGADGGKSIFGGITDANAEGGQAGQSLSDAAEVKMYKVMKSTTGSNIYYYGDYPNGQSVGSYYKVKVPSIAYLPLKNTTKTTKTLKYQVGDKWKTETISNLVEGKKVGDKSQYNYSASRSTPYFQIPGDATITEVVGQHYYGDTSGKRGEGGTLGTLKLLKAQVIYGGYAEEGANYGAGGDAMNLGLNGKYLYKRMNVTRESNNPPRFYSSRTGNLFTPNDFFYWSGWNGSDIVDLSTDNIVATLSKEVPKDQVFQMNFIHYKNGKTSTKEVSRESIVINHAKEITNNNDKLISTFYSNAWDLQRQTNGYYLCYINFTEENDKQKNIFTLNSSDSTTKNQWIPCWVEGIKPIADSVVEDHAHLPTATEREGGDGVVILKLTKPK